MVNSVAEPAEHRLQIHWVGGVRSYGIARGAQ